MPINYFYIKKESALRSAQLTGTGAATLETAYTNADFEASLNGAEVPATSYKTQILNIERELVHIIASDASHPYRTFLYAQSADLANLDSTPAYDSNGNPFFGVFDSCIDSDNSKPLTLQPTETLQDYSQSFFDDVDLYNYSIVGNTLQISRPQAFLTGCSWNYDNQAAAYDIDGNSPLPEMLANTWIAGVLSILPQVGWTDGAGTAPYYQGVYQEGIQLLRMSSQVNIPLASRNVAVG